MKRSNIGIILGLLLFSCVILCSCAHKSNTAGETGSFRVVKVNRFLRMNNLLGEGFEVIGTKRRHDVFGQDVSLDYKDRGEEIVVIWRYDGPAIQNAPVVLHFDYQYHADSKIYRISEPYETIVPGRYTFKFRNTGDDYYNRGEVEDWRVTILYGDIQVGHKQSKFFGKN